MKRTAWMLPLTLVFLLASCARTKMHYRADASAADLAEAISERLSATYRTADEDYLSDYVDLPQAGYSLSVRIACDGSCIDEVGVLHSDVGTEQPERLIRAYLSRSYEQNRAFYDSYIPTETPKLRDAEVRVYGEYVVYAILSPNEREQFFQEIEQALQN